jgi:diguanylate cyclase (GGDEF)-like protein
MRTILRPTRPARDRFPAKQGQTPTAPIRAADAHLVSSQIRAPRRHVAATGAVALLSTVWYAAWATGGAGPVAIACVALPLGTGVCGFAIAAMLRHARLEPAARRFWRTLLFSNVCVTLGFAIQAAVAFGDAARIPPIPTPAAALLGAGMVAALWAFGRVPLGIDSRAARTRQLLDRCIAFLGCSTLLFAVGLAPMIDAPELWSTQSLTLVALSFLMAVAGITKVSYIAGGPVDRVAIRLFAATGLVGAVTGPLAVATGFDGSVPAQAVVMPVTPVLVAFAARRQWIATGAAPRRANTWLPYLAVTAVDLPLIAILGGPVDWADQCVIAAAVVVNALVMVRQFVTIRENARLLRENRAAADRLRHEVTHDSLTGLANRGLFRDRLSDALATGETTVLLVDLDDFKTVNDSLGHEVGDQLLVAVAEQLRTAVGGEGLPARLGGDEFGVLLAPTSSEEQGETVALRVLAAFAGPISAHHLLVRASIGVATAGRGTPLDRLLRDADVALYAAKQRGKGNFVRYCDNLAAPVLAHARLGGELRRALDVGEFRVFYQPIMELARNRVVGVEALVRWQHPTRGLVSPAEFIPAAEGTGLIVALGRFVMREACRQTAAWLAEFGPDALQKIAPNVSVRQLHDPDFVADVRSALADTGLPADRLVLELTESAVLRGPQVSQTLQQLHDMGVRLALDDFGTGESSLSLLRAFPAAIIKLDKSFVDGIELDEPGTPAARARQAVARAVIQLAGALGLDTVAEGIENQVQADRLRELGYSLGQGYHLARPMPPEDMRLLLAAQRTAVTV